MGMPVITPSTTTRTQAITDIIESVALQETALSHILNAEGEKIQKMVALPVRPRPPAPQAAPPVPRPALRLPLPPPAPPPPPRRSRSPGVRPSLTCLSRWPSSRRPCPTFSTPRGRSCKRSYLLRISEPRPFCRLISLWSPWWTRSPVWNLF